MQFLQKLGKSLLFPIAMLPMAAIMMRLGDLALAHGDVSPLVKWIGIILFNPGNIVFANLGILFAIGIAFGFAKDHRGEAAIIGFLAAIVLNVLLAENTLPHLFYANSLTIQVGSGTDIHSFSRLLYYAKGDPNDPSKYVYSINVYVFGGIISGLIVAKLYNKFANIQLPSYLAFFSGKRFVPMVTIVTMVFAAFIFATIWPWVQYVFFLLGDVMAKAQTSGASGRAILALGTGAYGFFNRILIPTGLHNVINTILWFQLPILDSRTGEYVYGDIPAFAAGVPGSGNFQTGFFPIMMFGLPLAAFAMAVCADTSQRKAAFGLLGGCAAVSFITGVTEPIEFSFMFLAPILYGLHALFTGISLFVCTLLNLHLGFGFSAGVIDFLISLPISLQMQADGVAASPFWVLLIGSVASVLYFGLFFTIIKRLNLATPGRRDNPILAPTTDETLPQPELAGATAQNSTLGISAQPTPIAITTDPKMLKFAQLAQYYLLYCGGPANIKEAENCLTRLRIIVFDLKKVDIAMLKKRCINVIVVGNDGVQIIIGQEAQFVAQEFNKLLK